MKYTLLSLGLIMSMTSTSSFAAENTYKASTAEHKLDIVNIYSLEGLVQKNMDKGAFGYIRGGAEDEKNMQRNTTAFDHKYIMPRVFQGIKLEDVDISTSLLGIKIKTPVIQAPTAAMGLAHRDGEVASSKGMAKAGSIASISTYGNKTIKEVADGIQNNPFFFQLYMSKNNEFNEYMLNEAKKNDAKAIILTVDSTVGGYREEDIKNKFVFPLGMSNLEQFAKLHSDNRSTGKGTGISEIYSQAKQDFTLDDIRYVKEKSGLPVIVKGIQFPDDADRVIGAGADGIWVSDHGGRQLDSGPASFDMLPAIAKVVNKRVPVIFDSGVRRGSHVFKALASGADVVAVGRPVLYGLNLGGSEGVESVIEQFNKELKINMFLSGARNINDVKKTLLYTDEEIVKMSK